MMTKQASPLSKWVRPTPLIVPPSFDQRFGVDFTGGSLGTPFGPHSPPLKSSLGIPNRMVIW